MTVRKRKGKKRDTWSFDFMIRGVRYKSSIPEAQNKQDALNAEADARRAVYEGRYGRHAGNCSFEKFVSEVFMPYAKANRKKWSEDEQKCAVFVSFFKGKTFQQIAPMTIEHFKKLRRDTPTKRGTPRKASTINQELAVLSRIFNMAVENGYTNTNPLQKVRRLKASNLRLRYMSEDEEAALREHLPVTLLPVFELALQTGMRLNEILGLRRSEIGEDAIYLPASRTKEHKDKTIPLNEVARKVIESLDGEHLFGRGYEISWVERQWRAACKSAGVVGLRLHDLRHTFATRLSEMGVTETAIASLLGHSSLRMTARYTHATEEARRQAVDSLCARIVPQKLRIAEN
jgi:integrase